MLNSKKRNIVITVILTSLIIITTVSLFVIINKNSKDNELIISKCFENFEDVEEKITIHFEENKAKCERK